ncbi:MAG: hypothetical protein JSW63_11020 [Ignavibacterium sp.]|nr:MAG: hypothetical protein JSW63_11020 [Ignavibacterium sp.]
MAIKHSIDFDIHGIVGLRLINPSEGDVKIVRNKFDIIPENLTYEPDIVISYVNELELTNLTLIGLNTAGYNESGFFILSNGKDDVKIKIPFEDIGLKQVNIVCETGSPDIPLLNHILNFILLSKNFLPLHSTSFEYNGLGALVMGWAKGGKTESLFSFIKNGAKFVSDEISLISENGEKILALKIPICIWEWQFKEIPDLIPKISFKTGLLFKSIHMLDGINKRLHIGLLNKALPLLKTQLNIKILPSKIFNSNKILSQTSLDRIVLAMSHDSDEIIVEPAIPREIIDRMISSQEFERDYFVKYYNVFKFAFPNLRNEFLENINSLQYSLMKKVLADKNAFIVKHPYPVSFDKLFNKMKTIFNVEQMKISDVESESIHLQGEIRK